jgi:hypothetical protein
MSTITPLATDTDPAERPEPRPWSTPRLVRLDLPRTENGIDAGVDFATAS